ncbi:MAG: hypothetical protein CVU55_13355 [Deltaproteobacteria bacterium HGW-Deltaproteobacteria-13]|nr:MAG: hypothetical protein CVU55_13355 [Deltaproteobacteria bacterium HGW-Deltaproteobacteria-13]
MESSQLNKDIVEKYRCRVEEFFRRTAAMGIRNLENYYWYHTVDLGEGLITPGTYDYRDKLSVFPFPEEMRGMNVLDVGSASGFFSFEFERRGAAVTSVEIPALSGLDCFPGETLGQTINKLKKMMPSHSAFSREQQDKLFCLEGAEKLYNYFIDGPFKFCQRMLKSKVDRHYCTVYDICPERLGRTYDLVFLGDILLHTIHPLKALASAASVCDGTLILSQALPDAPDNLPMMVYMGGEVQGEDDLSWWWPNLSCHISLLKKLGFRQVSMVGKNSGYLQSAGDYFERAIIQAIR